MAAMRTLTRTCLAVTLAVGPSAGATGPARPQQATATAAAPAAPVPAAAGTVVGAPGAAAAAKDAAPVIEPQGYTYNPEGRRDPFISLLRRGADERSNSGPRPAGLAGIGTSEVSLRGTMISRGGYVGILQGVDNKSYIVRAGDKLLDGSIRSITADAMVILQQVNDPLSLEKEREVRKLLRQTEEAK